MGIKLPSHLAATLQKTFHVWEAKNKLMCALMPFIMCFMLHSHTFPDTSDNNYHYVLSKEFSHLALSAIFSSDESWWYSRGKKKRAVASSRKFSSQKSAHKNLIRANKRSFKVPCSIHSARRKSFSCIFATSLFKRSAKCKWHFYLCSLKLRWDFCKKMSDCNFIMRKTIFSSRAVRAHSTEKLATLHVCTSHNFCVLLIISI